MTVFGAHVGDTISTPVTLSNVSPNPTVGSELVSLNDKVDIESSAYTRMKKKWGLLHDLLGGTPAMRKAAERWLPKEPKEEQDAYDVRLGRAILYNMLEATLDGLVAKPFSQAVDMEDSTLPEQLEPMLENIDKTGTDITTFTRDVFRKALEYGLTHVLVDHPVMSEGATLADEQDTEARPVFVRIDPPDMLGWRAERTETGSLRLISIRFHEVRTESDGLYGDVEVDYIKVFNAPTGIETEDNLLGLGTWELWRKKPTEKDYSKTGTGTHTFPGVPLVTFYVNKTGFMEGAPPLEDMMWLNVAHWQTGADIRNTLRMVLSAIFWATGIEADALKAMVFGPNQFLKAEAHDAKFGFAEHSGAGLKAGSEELAALEARAEILGLKPLIERSARSTATGKIIDESRTSSDIQSWIRDLEGMMVSLFELAFKWLELDFTDETISLDIFNDFGITAKATEDLQELREMRNMIPPTIDHLTYLKEVKRRGLLSDEVVLEDVIKAVGEEIVLPRSEEEVKDDPEDDPEDD